jgi:hypothetical protein
VQQQHCQQQQQRQQQQQVLDAMQKPTVAAADNTFLK